MSRKSYDFREAAYFLNDCVPLDDLYHNVCAAIGMLDLHRLSKAKKGEIYSVLLTMADFLGTITPKQKGGGHETAA